MLIGFAVGLIASILFLGAILVVASIHILFRGGGE